MSVFLDLDDCVADNPNAVLALVELKEINLDMYEALKEMLDSFDPYNCRGDFFHHAAIVKARAAIAKAEGKI